MPENETSVFVPPDSASVEDPTTLVTRLTTGVESSKKGKTSSISVNDVSVVAISCIVASNTQIFMLFLTSS